MFSMLKKYLVRVLISVCLIYFLILLLMGFNSVEVIEYEDIEKHLEPNIRFIQYDSCPLRPALDVILQKPSYVLTYNHSLLASNLNVEIGGSWQPNYCKPIFEVAIVVPYRNRTEQLDAYLWYMHQFLPKQNVAYTIYLIEQTFLKPFNRGKLMNIGYKEALKYKSSHLCFIFHDVDLLPEDLRNIYACTKKPRHMSSSINVWDYKLLYSGAFGGAIAVQKHHFELANGFSNLYFGWGAEDDDLLARMNSHNVPICRFSNDISRYFMLSHKSEEKSPERHQLLKDARNRFLSDGLNSLHYKIIMEEKKFLYTHIVVDI